MKVGITGGIGSGKTTVCKVFEVLGVPVYYADDRAKWLMKNDPKIVRGMKEIIGESSYLDNGELNRAYIAEVIFEKKHKLDLVNALVHPKVWLDGKDWEATHKNAPYTLKEAALLYETNGYKSMDKIITVFANKTLRIQRVMARNQMTKKAVLARMNQQLPNLEKAKLADFVIKNDGKKSIIKQVLEVHHQLLELAKVPKS